MDDINELVEIVAELKLNIFKQDYSSTTSLIERWQVLVNRLESTLWDQKDLLYNEKEHRKLKAEIKKLKEERGDVND